MRGADKTVRPSVCLLFAGSRVAAEEAVCLPLRALRIVGYGNREAANDVFIKSSGGQIHRLLRIVTRRMVVIVNPVIPEVALRSSR